MQGITQSQFLQYIVDVIILIVAGAAQYLKLVPVGTDIFYPLFLLVIGHVLGTIPSLSTSNAVIAQNTQALQTTTQVVSDVKTGTPTNG